MVFSLREVCIWNPMGLPMGGVSSIGIDNICGEEGKSKEQAQIILQKLGTIIFDHLHLPKCQHGTFYIRNPI